MEANDDQNEPRREPTEPTGWSALRGADLAAKIEADEKQLARWTASGEVVSVPLAGGELVHPKWQFDEGMKLNGRIMDVWRTLTAVVEEWMAAMWLRAPADALSGQSAATALRVDVEGHEVVDARGG